MDTSISTCSPNHLGANYINGAGTHFRYGTSMAAHDVELILFAGSGEAEHRVHRMDFERDSGFAEWTAFIPEAAPGDHYGFRVYGDWKPRKGLRFDASKIQVDPAARMIGHWAGTKAQHASLQSFTDLSGNLLPSDNLLTAPRSVIGNPSDFDWGGALPYERLRSNLHGKKAVIYEASPRGATIKCKLLVSAKPGTYSALADPFFIDHLESLGITILELYVVAQSLPGTRGYWGYNTLAMGAPDWCFATAPENPLSVENEFKRMTKSLADRGIAVILDVVYNHTLEGNERGPSLLWKGANNDCYWHCGPSHDSDSREYYINKSGCGNTVNYYNPQARRLGVETLRRWILEYGVSGFRFDLAGATFSDQNGYDPNHPFLLAIENDPVLSEVFLSAEPWSADFARCQLGPKWYEWDDGYRDLSRRFWLGAEGTLPGFVYGITGNRSRVRTMITHDGFCFSQWAMHSGKSNDDGHGDNCSFDFGADGNPTDPEAAAKVNRRRMRVWKAAFAAHAFAPTPLIHGGDEFLHYPGCAHNNRYAHDDDVNGLNWDGPGRSPEFLLFAKQVMALRSQHPNLGCMIFDSADGKSERFGCYDPLGGRMTTHGWNDHEQRNVLLYFPGNPKTCCQKHADESSPNLIFIVNGHWEPMPIVLPAAAKEEGRQWVRVLYTCLDDPFARTEMSNDFRIGSRSAMLLVSETL